MKPVDKYKYICQFCFTDFNTSKKRTKRISQKCKLKLEKHLLKAHQIDFLPYATFCRGLQYNGFKREWTDTGDMLLYQLLLDFEDLPYEGMCNMIGFVLNRSRDDVKERIEHHKKNPSLIYKGNVTYIPRGKRTKVDFNKLIFEDGFI